MATTSPPGPSSPTSAGALLAADPRRDRGDPRRPGATLGLARSTVAQRVDALLAAELVYEAGGSTSTGGRPPTVLAFNQSAGIVLVADLGATHARLAVSATSRARRWPRRRRHGHRARARGACSAGRRERFAALLEQAGHTAAEVRGIGIGVPGPVEFASGRPVNPPIMPGWDGFSIPGWFADSYGAPVLVDNDVNIMARGEHWTHWRDTEHLLLVKVGTGIGCGIVAGGTDPPRRARRRRRHRPHPRHRRGRRLHVRERRLPGGGGRRPRAGRAAGRRGRRRADSRDVVRLVRAGDATAMRMVRDAGRSLGEVLAGTVNFFNPAVIVIGGDIAEAQAQLLAGVREGIFSRSLPLATRDLRIVPCQLGDRAGVIGAAIMAIDHVLAPEAIDQGLRPT